MLFHNEGAQSWIQVISFSNQVSIVLFFIEFCQNRTW